ncbi:NAD-dependent epimerase/dehydratase family protein [Akkermansia sp.]|uniref:NAD-dependent epimerase/dehydratase family protein n=1 Tax=Akkermansia sp. TaxID=1872421 RepID=UPI003AB00B6E
MTGLLCTEPRAVLILGTGYLGKALAESLRKAGHTALTADIDAQKAIYEADVTEGASMHSLAARIPSPHIIVMCASTRGGSEEAYRSLYIRGTQNTLEAFPGTPVIFCSSTSVYGITDGRWITEEHNVYPASGKSGLLIQAEQAVLAAGGTVVRLGALYGPDRCVLVSQYCKKGAALPRNMDRWINYIHRDDAVAALHLLCTLREPPTGIYNLTDRTPMQLGEIYSYLSGLLGMPAPQPEPLQAEARRGFSSQRISCSRLLALGWEPLYPSFADGVHNVLEALEAGGE